MYQNKYLKYKTKYLDLKYRTQYAGIDVEQHNSQILAEWKQSYPDLYGLIENLLIDHPVELPYIVNPQSMRGKDLVEILKYIHKENPDSDSIGYIFTGWYGIDDDRVALLILTLQCMLFVQDIKDQDTHLDPGIGDKDPYTDPSIKTVPIINKILAKYPYTKALCPFGRDCPYWNCRTSLTKFKQPYAYFVTSNSTGMNHEDILKAADIIKNNLNKDVKEAGKAHFLLFDHLMPTVKEMIDDKLVDRQDIGQYYDFDQNMDIDEIYETNWDNVPPKRKCKNQKERDQWGQLIKDKYWRANYPYVTDLCLERKGLYYWD